MDGSRNRQMLLCHLQGRRQAFTCFFSTQNYEVPTRGCSSLRAARSIGNGPVHLPLPKGLLLHSCLSFRTWKNCRWKMRSWSQWKDLSPWEFIKIHLKNGLNVHTHSTLPLIPRKTGHFWFSSYVPALQKRSRPLRFQHRPPTILPVPEPCARYLLADGFF